MAFDCRSNGVFLCVCEIFVAFRFGLTQLPEKSHLVLNSVTFRFADYTFILYLGTVCSIILLAIVVYIYVAIKL